jgi:hypothetical protein
MKRTPTAALLLALAAATACAQAEDSRAARRTYNGAVAALAAGQWEEAQKGFLSARDEAGVDPELRYAAAYNLGLAHASHAQTLEKEKPQEALDQLHQAAAWFRDAVRLRPEDSDARVNLEVVLRRAQGLADVLNKGKNSLEARLDRLIDDQRRLLDQVRQLMDRMAQAGAKAEPSGFRGEMDGLSTSERTLLADAGLVGELAGDELGLLQAKSEEERTDQEKVRLVQLSNLEHYLQLAQGGLADTRSLLRRMRVDDAHRRADAALADLKRAREQLLDPVTVLKGVAEDQATLLVHEQALEALSQGAIKLQGGAPAQVPPWLTPTHLQDRQQDATQRTGEVLARLGAGVQAKTGTTTDKPEEARVIQAAAEALPLLEKAVTSMQGAHTALAAPDLRQAVGQGQEALVSILEAMERFAGMRDLIELAHADQTAAVTLLTPPDPAKEPDGPALSTQERLRLVREKVVRNADRLGRLQSLFTDALRDAEAKAHAGAGAQPGGQPPDPQQQEAAKQQVEAERQRFGRAEELRVAAHASVLKLGALLDQGPKAKASASEPLAAAQETLANLEELRRLFFSIVEHVRDLLRSQSETRDRTASIKSSPEEQHGSLMAPLADTQAQHAALGEALSQALSEQADAAAASQDPQAQQAAGPLKQAAPEMASAAERLGEAARLLLEGKEQASVGSYDLEPTLQSQQAAMEHLENVLRALQPPQEQPEQQQDQQQQQPQGGEEEQVSQRQAERRLQAIRDRDAERERERQRRQRNQPEAVEKDW